MRDSTTTLMQTLVNMGASFEDINMAAEVIDNHLTKTYSEILLTASEDRANFIRGTYLKGGYLIKELAHQFDKDIEILKLIYYKTNPLKNKYY